MTEGRRMPPLNALRAFEAAARHLSFKEAAAELFVTPTAVSHQIRNLEDLVGLKLFERSGNTITLTRAGERFFPVLRDGLTASRSRWWTCSGRAMRSRFR